MSSVHVGPLESEFRAVRLPTLVHRSDFFPVQSAKDAPRGRVITLAAQKGEDPFGPRRVENDARESEQHSEDDAGREEAETQAVNQYAGRGGRPPRALATPAGRVQPARAKGKIGGHPRFTPQAPEAA